MEISKGQATKSKTMSLVSFMIALFGSTLSMWGASWDITSHLLRRPETFFTPSHMILYIGVGISLISAILSLVLITKKETRKESFSFGFKIIIAGVILQIIAGPGDFYWHELFGIDGLLSPTHLALGVGILMVSLGSTLGFARIHPFITNKKFMKSIISVSFGIFWFSVMWLIFFFVLPISEGDTHNFNPNPYVAAGLSFAVIPFVFSILFWAASKTLGFGVASMSALVFLVMNVTSNIITSEKLLFYLSWFAAPMISALIADYILNKKSKSKFVQKYSEKLSGSVLGSMFFIFCFPMLAMTFLNFYLYNDVFPYDVLPTSSNVVFQIWLISIVPGMLGGMAGMWFASKKLERISNLNESN